MWKIFFIPTRKRENIGLMKSSFQPVFSTIKMKLLGKEIYGEEAFYSKLFLRKVISLELGAANTDFIFRKTEYGKPYLVGYEGFHFNISHTRGAIVIAIADEPVGIDVEVVREVDFAIVKRFFSVAEKNYIQQCSNVDSGFFEVWTKKEAYSKYIGVGLNRTTLGIDVFESSIISKTFYLQIDNFHISCCCDLVEEEKEVIILMDERTK